MVTGSRLMFQQVGIHVHTQYTFCMPQNKNGLDGTQENY